jgi:RimJ/RimL family protein N-acetyltransferase
VKWFRARLGDPRWLFYVALDEHAEPVGQVRYELDERMATVSVGLDPQFRGRGWGSAVIRRAAEELFKSKRVERIHAYIKPDNGPSLKAFALAGFVNREQATVKGKEATLWVFERSLNHDASY